MSTRQEANTFIITREDRAFDPVTLMSEGLVIGRAPDSELNLNHPTVSRLHAGIRKLGGRFYIFHLSPSNSTTLNGNLVHEKAALADGDVVQIGPFFLFIDFKDSALSVRVTYQTAVRVGEADVLTSGQPQSGSIPQTAGAGADSQVSAAAAAGAGAGAGEAEADEGALDVFWEKRKREAGKVSRPSPLRPRQPAPKLGKARFNWKPTRDLERPWPFSIFTWGVVVVGLLSIVAAFSYTSAFSPAPVSNAHARAGFNLSPAIAREPNANSCTTCHSLSTSMETNCATCHQTENFTASITAPHKAAGVGCISCHAEHRGAEFRPGVAPFNATFQKGVRFDETCAGCHNDNNRTLYRGRRVFTPHEGTFGYPVVNGHWKWKGVDEEAWQQKPEDLKQLVANWPMAAESEDARRSAQFHALHVYRVRTTGELAGVEGTVSCSTCHKSFGAMLDRETPRTTCAACHSGKTDAQTGRALLAADTANCTSCHVQHVRDKRHWNPSLLAAARDK
ncbi:MAG TPA: FHA domain-containing protein [Pyrinomonadaceae bacterium]